MQTTFLVNGDFDREITRKRAKGHKSLSIAEDVNCMDAFTMRTEGTSLRIEKDENPSGEEVYTVLCEEFGIVGGETGLKSRISIIHLDNGLMLLTLLKGALVIYLENELTILNVGDIPAMNITQQSILWVNQKTFLDYGRYMGEKGNFLFDYEFAFEIQGTNKTGNCDLHVQLLKQEDVDISLGYIAQWEQQRKNHADYMRTSSLMQAISQSSKLADDDYEFDDDEEDYYDDEDDDYEEEDDF